MHAHACAHARSCIFAQTPQTPQTDLEESIGYAVRGPVLGRFGPQTPQTDWDLGLGVVVCGMEILKRLKECGGCARRRAKLKKMAAMVEERFSRALGRGSVLASHTDDGVEDGKNGESGGAQAGASGVWAADADESGAVVDGNDWGSGPGD